MIHFAHLVPVSMGIILSIIQPNQTTENIVLHFQMSMRFCLAQIMLLLLLMMMTMMTIMLS